MAGALRSALWVAAPIAATLFFMDSMNRATAASFNENLCNDDWRRTITQFESAQERIRQWAALGAKCGNSGLYEVRLGKLYMLSGRYTQARKVVEATLTLKTPYKKELLNTLADVDLNQQNFDAALRQYEAIMKEYPNWYSGYGGVGTVKLIQHKFKEAVHYFNEADKRGRALYIYRDLTIAYHQLGENKQAVKAINRAYRFDKNIVKDRDAMLAAARSYVFLHKYKVADGFLKMLVQATPEAANDPEVVETKRYVAKKLKRRELGE